MATQPHYDDGDPEDVCGFTYEELSPEESRAMFDRNARAWLDMSGEEFIRRWDAGEIEDLDRTDVVMLQLMMPLAR